MDKIVPIINESCPKIDSISDGQDYLKNEIKSAGEIINRISDRVYSDIEIKYFSDKTQFYIYLTDILLKLPNGANVDVTNFEKNHDIPYDIGEDEYITTFMNTWTKSVKTCKINVRQLVHIATPQDYKELKDRVDLYKQNHNFSISAIVGLPIVPYEDIMIVNQEYVFIGLSNDASTPNNLSFGYVIRSQEIASEFRNYFNIYWSNQFSTIIKDKDNVKNKSLIDLKNSIYEIDYNADIKKYNRLALEVYHICERSPEAYKLLKNLNLLYDNPFYEIIQNDVVNEIKEHSRQISQRINNYFEFKREMAGELISKMIFNATDRICAASLDIDGIDFWVEEEGEQVFQANLAVITKKEVSIERVFICTSEKKEELDSIMQKQLQAGIELYYTEYRQRIGGEFEDFLIIDHDVLLLLCNSKIKVSISKSEIEKYYNKFAQIKKMGTKLSL